ncbi:hypothetical protein HN51_057293 [Arachis hypogaea]|uniref:Protein ApaG n=2 Tax=Arachis TaxID=3817 RepID=A0A444WWL8_ARAHY|nr:uncharacterized protein LOC107622003 isoform X1 [Arachis ipaensis]XP_025680399.1 uncharacterized protein LOC112782270 isoform X1 [Arachis hypogaea]QHN80226.1 Protein ApaG [Arachis hypogaea]RYQ81811.1 hypothetical protein Ahy_B10g100410 [Arachis hypogaea]
MQLLSINGGCCMELRLPAIFTESKEAFTWRIGEVNWRNRRQGRKCGGMIVACGAKPPEMNGGKVWRSIFCPSHNYAILKHQMEAAAKSEDYEEAARIRDTLKYYEKDMPVLRLRRLLKEAVADERFEDAASYRDELIEIAPHSLLKCYSDATTLGIRVQVRSEYIQDRSHPSKGLYFYAYKVRITNNSIRPVQLLRRHWIITDAHGKSEDVWGLGVVGEQPAIRPKSSFEYTSGFPLKTPNGKMEGDYEMIYIDRAFTRAFKVAVAPFSLSMLGDYDDNDVNTI